MDYNFTVNGGKVRPQMTTLKDFKDILDRHNVEFECHNSRQDSEVVFFNFCLNNRGITVKATPIK